MKIDPIGPNGTQLDLIWSNQAKLDQVEQIRLNWFQLDPIGRKQDSKELSPKPLENALKTFDAKKKLFKLIMPESSLCS